MISRSEIDSVETLFKSRIIASYSVVRPTMLEHQADINFSDATKLLSQYSHSFPEYLTEHLYSECHACDSVIDLSQIATSTKPIEEVYCYHCHKTNKIHPSNIQIEFVITDNSKELISRQMESQGGNNVPPYP